MRHLLKYILSIILALAFYDGANNESSAEYDFLNEIYLEHIIDQETFLSSPKTDICPPRQVSTISVPRAQSSSRRQVCHDRSDSGFIKAGKPGSSGIIYISRNTSYIQYSTLMEPGHRLIRLCRFII